MRSIFSFNFLLGTLFGVALALAYQMAAALVKNVLATLPSPPSSTLVLNLFILNLIFIDVSLTLPILFQWCQNFLAQTRLARKVKHSSSALLSVLSNTWWYSIAVFYRSCSSVASRTVNASILFSAIPAVASSGQNAASKVLRQARLALLLIKRGLSAVLVIITRVMRSFRSGLASISSILVRGICAAYNVVLKAVRSLLASWSHAFRTGVASLVAIRKPGKIRDGSNRPQVSESEARSSHTDGRSVDAAPTYSDETQPFGPVVDVLATKPFSLVSAHTFKPTDVKLPSIDSSSDVPQRSVESTKPRGLESSMWARSSQAPPSRPNLGEKVSLPSLSSSADEVPQCRAATGKPRGLGSSMRAYPPPASKPDLSEKVASQKAAYDHWNVGRGGLSESIWASKPAVCGTHDKENARPWDGSRSGSGKSKITGPLNGDRGRRYGGFKDNMWAPPQARPDTRSTHPGSAQVPGQLRGRPVVGDAGKRMVAHALGVRHPSLGPRAISGVVC